MTSKYAERDAAAIAAFMVRHLKRLADAANTKGVETGNQTPLAPSH